MVASFAPLLCLPKAFLGPIQSMFESFDQQKYFIITTIVASFVDIGVAWLLIPSHGALGACIGSGAAQFTAVISMWAVGIARYKIRLPWGFFFKLAAISGIAALAAYGIVSRVAPLPGLIGGSVISTLLFITLGYMLKILEPEDRDRFKILTKACPQAVAAPINYLLDRFTRQLTMDSTSI